MKVLDLVSRDTAAQRAQDRILFAIARVALALVFLYSGFGQLTGFPAFAAYLSGAGASAPALSIATSIVVELGVATCLAIGYQARYSAWVLGAFTVAATFVGHPFWQGSPAADAMLLHALKNLAILGGLLAIGIGQSAVDRLQGR